MGVKVVKFGGSSVADAIQLPKVKAIIDADPDRKYVIVSAPGKRYEGDNKITDLLYLCKTHIEHNLGYEQIFQVICDRFRAVELNLGLNVDLTGEFAKIDENLKNGASTDYIASRGEYLNAILTAAYLDIPMIDTEGLIVFNEKGKLLDEETNQNLKEALSAHERAVLPGFYGSYLDGRCKTFSRGGSDITGSLVARAVDADVYENWTDVSGFLIADPRIVPDAPPIQTVSYLELRELSYMGANVLHEDAIYPVRAANIPINIRNTNAPEDPGTIISEDSTIPVSENVITGIAGSKGHVVINLYKNMMSATAGFVRRCLSILENYDVPVEHLPSGIDTISLVVSGKSVEGKLSDIVEEMEKKLEPDRIDVNEDVALIATVGRGMSRRCGTSASLFTSLAAAGINVRMIDQGSSEMNIIVGVECHDFEKAIKAIYSAFVQK